MSATESARPDLEPRRTVEPSAETQFNRLVRGLAADLNRPNPAIYWIDMLASAATGYAALALAIHSDWLAVSALCVVVSSLALYRALMFIHELVHLAGRAPRGFRTAWNALIGIPLLTPSFFCEDVHLYHHGKHSYGTEADPEYLPLAGRSPATLALFVLSVAVVPLLLLLRSAIAAPAAVFSRRVRILLIERCSSLVINPRFRRSVRSLAGNRTWPWLEAAATLWAWTLCAVAIMGYVSLRTIAIVTLVAVGVATANQLRTLVAHRWESDGRPRTLVGQMTDTVNVPPPGLLPALWAPLGLRYHALHHLMPELPYHALGAAHRRLCSALSGPSPYALTIAPGFLATLRRIVSQQPVRDRI